MPSVGVSLSKAKNFAVLTAEFLQKASDASVERRKKRVTAKRPFRPNRRGITMDVSADIYYRGLGRVLFKREVIEDYSCVSLYRAITVNAAIADAIFAADTIGIAGGYHLFADIFQHLNGWSHIYFLHLLSSFLTLSPLSFRSSHRRPLSARLHAGR